VTTFPPARFLFLFATSLFFLSAARLQAGPAETLAKSLVEPEPNESEPLNIVNIRSSYVFEGDFKRGNGRLGSQSALENRISYNHRIRISGRWYFRMGVRYDRFDFSSSPSPLPNHLQGIAGVLALEYLVDGQTGFLFETQPGAYFENDIDSDAFNAPTVLALAIPLVKEKLYLVGGALYTGFGEYPVLPVAGLSWQISDAWKLSLLFPNPRMIYTVNDTLKLWAGGELVGGAYRVDDRTSGPGKLSGALLDYTDYRVGAGVNWTVCTGFSIDAGAGWSIQRVFDYHRADDRYRINGAPAITLRGVAEF